MNQWQVSAWNCTLHLVQKRSEWDDPTVDKLFTMVFVGIHSLRPRMCSDVGDKRMNRDALTACYQLSVFTEPKTAHLESMETMIKFWNKSIAIISISI